MNDPDNNAQKIVDQAVEINKILFQLTQKYQDEACIMAFSIALSYYASIDDEYKETILKLFEEDTKLHKHQRANRRKGDAIKATAEQLIRGVTPQ